MDEKLEVVVQQEVGVIEWNFEQLKEALSVKMKEYEGLIYTADKVKEAKVDIAALRKLKKAISDKRIEIKNKCLEPYNVIEAQASELTELVDKPIGFIDKQLTEYENNRKAAVREKVLAYMDEAFKDLPASVAATLKVTAYDTRFENATMPTRTWKQYVDDAASRTARDLAMLDDENVCEPEFKEKALAEYNKNLVLNEALSKIAELRKQKEEIIAKEREKIAAEERAKAEAAVKAKEEEQIMPKPVVETGPEDTTLNNAQFGGNKAVIPAGVKTPNPTPENGNLPTNRVRDEGVSEIYTLRIKATENQIAKIKGFIEYCGAMYREA